MFAALPAAAQQEVIPLSSPLYAQVDGLYLALGLAAPSSARPWNQTEFRAVLDRIGRLPEGRLDATTRELYERIREMALVPLRFDVGGIARLDAGLEANLEAYAHTNGEAFYNEDDWLYGYTKRRPLLYAALEASLGDWFYLTSDFEYAWNFNTEEPDHMVHLEGFQGGVGAVIPDNTEYTDKSYAYFRTWAKAYSDPFVLNIPPDVVLMDYVFPKRAFLSLGGDWWNLVLGRDRLQWGNGHSGNLILDGNRDFDNFIKFSLGSGAFRYELLTTIYDKFPYDDEISGESKLMSRYFLLHRLEFRIFDIVTLAVSENIMYQDESFNIRYLNPAFIYHNWDEAHLFNALAGAEVDIAIAPGWNLYGQFALDQLRAPKEAYYETDAWALLAGVEYGAAVAWFGLPGLLSLSLEAAYTSPLLYRRDYVDFLSLVRRVSFVNGDVYSIEYIGYPYGGDAVTAQFDAAWSVPGRWDLGFRAFWMLHGGMNPFVSHNQEGVNTGDANLQDSFPTGGEENREYTLALSLKGSFTIPLPWAWPALTAWAGVDYIAKWNKLAWVAGYTAEDAEAGTSPLFHIPGLSQDFQFYFGVGVKL
jgi:hypothetical protein